MLLQGVVTPCSVFLGLYGERRKKSNPENPGRYRKHQPKVQPSRSIPRVWTTLRTLRLLARTKKVTASSSFRPSLGHCELVFSFAKQSQRFLAALRLGMTEEKGLGITKEKGLGMTEEGVIASLVCSLSEAISDCFASLATAKNAAGLLRFARSDPFFVTARSYSRFRSSLSSPHLVEMRDRFVASLLAVTKRRNPAVTDKRNPCSNPPAGHCELVFSLAKQSLRPLRRFDPRGDKVWVSLRGRRFVSEAASLFAPTGECHCEPRLFVWRSSLRDSSPLRGFGRTDEGCHCEVVFSFPKQPQPLDCFGPSPLAMTGQKSHCEVVVSSPKQSRFFSFFGVHANQNYEVASSLRSSQRREIRPPTFASSLRSSQ